MTTNTFMIETKVSNTTIMVIGRLQLSKANTLKQYWKGILRIPDKILLRVVMGWHKATKHCVYAHLTYICTVGIGESESWFAELTKYKAICDTMAHTRLHLTQDNFHFYLNLIYSEWGIKKVFCQISLFYHQSWKLHVLVVNYVERTSVEKLVVVN